MKISIDNPAQQQQPGTRLPARADGLSSLAVSKAHGEDSPYFEGWREYNANPYHPLNNPSGIIQMGLAENQVNSITYLFIFIFICMEYLFTVSLLMFGLDYMPHKCIPNPTEDFIFSIIVTFPFLNYGCIHWELHDNYNA
jgi:hypothetical protein